MTHTLGPGGMVAQPPRKHPIANIAIDAVRFIDQPSFSAFTGSERQLLEPLSSSRPGRM
jgi:hypothetical protein